MTLHDFLAKLAYAKEVPGGWQARCPSHEDKNPSLSVKEASSDRRILLHCFAGCSVEAICAAIDIEPADLFPEREKAEKKEIVATYDYCGLDGELRFQTVRFSPKTFRQRQPDGKGDWEWSLNGVEPCLYKWPDLKGKPAVVVCEGEKDADAALKIGLPATTSPMGAGKWRDGYVEQLKQAGVQRVAILPDNDPVGREHAETVAASCHKMKLATRIVNLPGVPEHGDLSDYLATHTKEELVALMRNAPAWAPEGDGPDRTFEVVGDQRYRLSVRSTHVHLEIQHLRRESHKAWGELRVACNGFFPEAKHYRDGLIHVGDIDLSSVNARQSRAKLLAERSGDKNVDWYGLLEEFAIETLAAESAGTPAVRLRDVAEPDENKVAEWDVGGLPILADLPMCIFGDSGAGKAQPLDAKVLMLDGWKAMGDLRVGDRLASPDGLPSTVVAIHQRGVRQVYRVTFSDGRSTEACAEHLWLVRHNNWRRTGRGRGIRKRSVRCGPQLLTTQEIVDLLSKPVFRNKLYITTAMQAEYGHQNSLPVHPWLLGILLGDGSLSANGLSFTTADSEILERVELVVWPEFEVRPSGKYHYNIVEATGRSRKGHQGVMPNRLKEALKSLDMMGCRAHEKWIPDLYMNASRAARQQLLTGLMDTDGFVGRNGCVSYSSTSRRLAEQVVELARSLGAVCSVTKRHGAYRMRDGERKLTRLAYTVHISHRDPQSFVGLSRKKMRLAKRQRMRLLKIESIKPSRQTRAQCITVSHHAGLYITDDHIVTHNSFMSLWIAGTLASRGLPVLYCDWEFSAGEQRKRFRRLFGEMPAALHYVRCDRPLTRDADRLSRMVQDLAIQYAVADSIGFAADGPAETHEVAMRYFDGIRRLRVGSLSLSHIAKYVEEGQQPTAFGSAYFRAGARSMWFIQQSSSNPPDEIRVGLYHHKSNTGPRLPARAYVLTFSRSSITVAPTDIYAVPDLAGMLPLPERLLRLLRDDGERTVKRAAEELNVTQKAIYAVVAKHRREFWKSGDTIAVAETERQPESSPATPPPSDKDGHIDF